MPQPLLWTFALLLIGLLLALGAVLRVRRHAARKLRLPDAWQITARPVFGNDERRFYRHICQSLPQHIVLSKLPLVRFCQPTDPQEARYWHGLLGPIHVTFAICSASGRVLAVIDLDNDHGTSRRVAQIKESVLAACRVQYLRCQPDQLPSAAELQHLVPPTTPGLRSTSVPTLVNQSRDRLSSTVASRRQERAVNWHDSRQDSRLSADSVAGELHDGGGIVVDHLPAPLRH